MASVRRSVSRASADHRRGAVLRDGYGRQVQGGLVDLLPGRSAGQAAPGCIDDVTRWFERAEAELERRVIGTIQ